MEKGQPNCCFFKHFSDLFVDRLSNIDLTINHPPVGILRPFCAMFFN